jgi:HEAT repeat protein
MDTLEHSDVETQILAVQSLGRLQATQAISLMLDLLQTDHLHGPQSGLYHAITDTFQTLAGIKKEVENAFPGKFPMTFGTSSGSTSLPEMMGLLGDENFMQLNQMLAEAESRVEKLSDSLHLPPELVKAVSNQTWKFGAMFADARDTRTEQVKVLIELLKSESSLKRAAAALSLPWYTDPQAIQPLEQAIQDKDETVRRASIWAQAALKNILGYQT